MRAWGSGFRALSVLSSGVVGFRAPGFGYPFVFELTWCRVGGKRFRVWGFGLGLGCRVTIGGIKQNGRQWP